MERGVSDGHPDDVRGVGDEQRPAFLGDPPPRFCYRHEWRQGDLIVWENRCVLHRATPYDTVPNKRCMQRTTVSGEPRKPAAR